MILVRRRAGGSPTGPARASRARNTEFSAGDKVFQWLAGVAAVIPVAALALIIVIMVVQAIPAIIYSGLTFFTSTTFSIGHLYATTLTTHNGVSAPQDASYGALVFIVGTLATSVIAICLAVPISVGGVLMLSEWIPERLQGFLSTFVDLLAGIPSVVFGLWGITIFGPFAAAHIYPTISHLGRFIPFLKGPVGFGEGLLTASLVLALMVIPIVASTTRELVKRVPVLAKEGALALGMTRYETVRVVTIPYIRSGIIAATLLGWGRALGETIAVLLIVGDLTLLPHSIFASTSTIAATIASTLDSAFTDYTHMALSALAELGVLLLVISLATNLAGRLIVRRVSTDALPVGRGI
ncbi:MAG: phosphate ABC transporter permease subunit PstC [Candidatus Dormibacteria bacterium]|jgi:phosphate transport system permease protein